MINKVRKRLPSPQYLAESIVKNLFSFGNKAARKIQLLLFFRLLLKKARSYTKEFINIKGIDSNQKAKLLKNVRGYQIRFALSDLWEKTIGYPFLVIYSLISVGALFGAPAIAIYVANGAYDVALFSASFINLAVGLNLVNMFIIIILLQFLTEIIPSQQTSISIPILLLGLFALISWLLNNGTQLISSDFEFVILSSSIFQAIFLFALAFALIGFTLGRIISVRLFRYYYPDAFIAHGLINIIAKLDDESNSWTTVEFRRQIIYNIEEISYCIEKDLSRALRSGDKGTDEWLKKATSSIASSLRQKKKWLLIPKVDTKDHLYDFFEDALSNFVSGNWDLLEQEEPIITSPKQIWVEQVRNVFRVLFLGGVPILLLWVIQNSVLALRAPFDDYAIAGTLLWAIFTMITTYDPLFSTKINAVKDVINLIPFVGDKS